MILFCLCFSSLMGMFCCAKTQGHHTLLIHSGPTFGQFQLCVGASVTRARVLDRNGVLFGH